jgi:hypothetical protein
MTNRWILALGVLGAVLACSKGPSHAASAGASASQAALGNACDRKLLTPEDAADILGAPVTGAKPIPGDPQSCEFQTASYSSITASIRPGLGDVTVKTWLDGKMPLSAVPLSGVGDKAAWVAELGEVVATKGNVLCDIQAGAGGGGAKNDKQAKAGALCNKIFAAG